MKEVMHYLIQVNRKWRSQHSVSILMQSTDRTVLEKELMAIYLTAMEDDSIYVDDVRTAWDVRYDLCCDHCAMGCADIGDWECPHLQQLMEKHPDSRTAFEYICDDDCFAGYYIVSDEGSTREPQ